MSQATNVDTVRRAYEAAIRKPKPDFATMNAIYDPDHEFVSRITAVEGHSFRGARGFGDWLAQLHETWESCEWTIDRVVEADKDRVFAVLVFNARSRGGGVPVEDHFVNVVTLRDEKIVRTEGFSTPEQALQAVWLAE
jgi:ketosteroid isomerase-like protein